jgi:hypothetical protein
VNPECGLPCLDPKPVEADLIMTYEHYHTHAPAHPDPMAFAEPGARDVWPQFARPGAAGIYRASEAIKAIEGRVSPGASAAVGIVRSWALQHKEFRRARRFPDQGEDILMLATKARQPV